MLSDIKGNQMKFLCTKAALRRAKERCGAPSSVKFVEDVMMDVNNSMSSLLFECLVDRPQNLTIEEFEESLPVAFLNQINAIKELVGVKTENPTQPATPTVN